MALDILSVLLAAPLVVAGTLVFVQRRLLHAVIALAVVAAVSALIFLYLGQPLVALLQLLIFVGGLSTYLMVAVAAEEKRVSLRGTVVFTASFVLIAAVFIAVIYALPAQAQSGASFVALAGAALPQYYGIILATLFLLFAVAMASVLVIKKFSKLVN